MILKFIAVFVTILCLSAQGADFADFKTLAKYHYGDNEQAATNAFALISATPADQMAPVETALIEALATPDATAEGKAFLCRMLQRVGTDKCIPAVTGLLSDEILADYAVAVLERTGTPAATAALRQALDTAPVKVKLGLLNSLGVLQDTAAVKPIARLATDSDPVMALAAMRALGKIGGEAAVNALQSLTVTESLQRSYRESLIDAAKSLPAQKAGDVFAKVLTANDPVSTAGALAGLLRVDPDRGIAMIKVRLKENDSHIVAGVLTLIALNKGGDALIQSIGDVLNDAPFDLKAKLIIALGASRNPLALPYVSANLSATNAAIHQAVIEALGEIGTAAQLKPLLAIDDSGVLNAVAQMTDPAVNAALVGLLNDAALTKPAIAALVSRNANVAVPSLLDLTGSTQVEIRAAAWQALKMLADDNDIQALVKTAFAVTNGTDFPLAIAAVKNVCTLAVNRDKCFEPVLAAYEGGSEPLKKAILEIAAKAGTAKALELEKKTIHSDNPVLASTAIKALAGWPDKSVAPYLLDLASKTAQDADKLIALRAYIKIAGNEDIKMSNNERCNMLKKAYPLATGLEEKRQIIDALSLTDGPDFYTLITKYIQNPETQADGERTGLQVLINMKNRNTPEAQALVKLLAASSNTTVAGKAGKMVVAH